MKTLDSLPTELITEIFTYLDYLTLNLRVRTVCRRFRDVIDYSSSQDLRRQLFRPRTPRKGIARWPNPSLVMLEGPDRRDWHPALFLLSTDLGILSYRQLKLSDFGFYIRGRETGWSWLRRHSWDLSERPIHTRRFIPLEGTTVADERALREGAASFHPLVSLVSPFGFNKNTLTVREVAVALVRLFAPYANTYGKKHPNVSRSTRREIRTLDNHISLVASMHANHPYIARATRTYDAPPDSGRGISFVEDEILRVSEIGDHAGTIRRHAMKENGEDGIVDPNNLEFL